MFSQDEEGWKLGEIIEKMGPVGFVFRENANKIQVLLISES